MACANPVPWKTATPEAPRGIEKEPVITLVSFASVAKAQL